MIYYCTQFEYPPKLVASGIFTGRKQRLTNEITTLHSFIVLTNISVMK